MTTRTALIACVLLLPLKAAAQDAPMVLAVPQPAPAPRPTAGEPVTLAPISVAVRVENSTRARLITALRIATTAAAPVTALVAAGMWLAAPVDSVGLTPQCSVTPECGESVAHTEQALMTTGFIALGFAGAFAVTSIVSWAIPLHLRSERLNRLLDGPVAAGVTPTSATLAVRF